MLRQDELHRRVFAEVFNLVVRVFFGVHLRDIDCAFKVFDGDLIRSLQLSSPGALINTEIQAKARRQGARLQQVRSSPLSSDRWRSDGRQSRKSLRAR